MIRRVIVLVLFCSALSAYAADLFVDNKPRDGVISAELAPTDTLGGYAIYQGGLPWRIARADFDLMIGPATIPTGKLDLQSFHSGALIATQYVSANLEPRYNTGEWHGGPCSSNWLYKRIGRNKTAETCLFIGADQLGRGGRTFAFLMIGVAQYGKNSTYYFSIIGLNTAVFGFEETRLSDWSAEAIAKSPRQKDFLDRTTAWAEQFRSAVEQSFHEQKNGVKNFGAVPPIIALIKVPEELRDKGYPLEFLSAVANMSGYPRYGAFAYSPAAGNDVAWSNVHHQESQAQADELALARCEENRQSGQSPCILLKLQ